MTSRHKRWQAGPGPGVVIGVCAEPVHAGQLVCFDALGMVRPAVVGTQTAAEPPDGYGAHVPDGPARPFLRW